MILLLSKMPDFSKLEIRPRSSTRSWPLLVVVVCLCIFKADGGELGGKGSGNQWRVTDTRVNNFKQRQCGFLGRSKGGVLGQRLVTALVLDTCDPDPYPTTPIPFSQVTSTHISTLPLGLLVVRSNSRQRAGIGGGGLGVVISERDFRCVGTE